MRQFIQLALLALLVTVTLIGCGDGSDSVVNARLDNTPAPEAPGDDGAGGVPPDATTTLAPTVDTPAAPTGAHTETPTPTPDENTGLPRPEIEFPGCEAIAAESHYCLALSGGQINLVGLDSGHACPIITTEAPAGLFLVSASIAWLDEDLYVCGQDGLIRISLRDGSWQAAGTPCTAVARYHDGLLLNRWPASRVSPDGEYAYGAPLTWYPDYEAVQHEAPERTFTLGDFTATMTVQGERLYTAWHAGKSVDVGDLGADQLLGALTLENYDGWLLGMSVTEDGYLALSGDPWGQTLYVFDTYDGHEIKRFNLEMPLSGLACLAGAAGTPRATPTPTASPQVMGIPSPTPCDDDCPDPCAGLESDPKPFRLHELPPSIPIEMNCLGGGYGSSNYAVREDLLVPGATEELHVIGVYEGRGNAGFRPHAQGVIDVTVHARPKPIVLALSSYESTLWRITLDPGAQLSRVILQGYLPQEAEGVPEGVPIHHRAEEACGYAYGWEVSANGGGGDYELMLASLRRLTGLVETSFQGCYAGNGFEVPYWSGEPPTATPTPIAGDEAVPREQVVFPGCEAVTAEGQYCLTTTYDGIALLGLESGNVCPLATTTAGVGSPLTASIAWRGELMFACTGAGLVRISLRDGSWEAAQVACGAVSEYAGGILLSTSFFDSSSWLESPLRAYPDYAAVLDGAPSRSFDVGHAATRFTVNGETFYGAWHSTSSIDVADLSTNQALSPIMLEGYDGWILGMAVTDGGELIISGDSWGDTIRIFDVATGAQRRELRPSMPVYGLSCVSH